MVYEVSVPRQYSRPLRQWAYRRRQARVTDSGDTPESSKTAVHAMMEQKPGHGSITQTQRPPAIPAAVQTSGIAARRLSRDEHHLQSNSLSVVEEFMNI